MRRNASGFALVVTMLVGLVVLIVIVTTASISTLGTRQSVSDERQTYRAQLVAESGINTFPGRMRASGFRVGTSLDVLNDWVQCPSTTLSGDTFCFTGLGNGAHVTLSIATVADTRVTVSSTGTLGNRSTKVVVDDFAVGFDAGFYIPLGAALTSLPYVKVGGNASIKGQAGSTDGSDVIAGLTTVTDAVTEIPHARYDDPTDAGVFSVTVQDGSYLPVDGYVRIQDSSGSGRTYRVLAKDGDTLTLGVLDPPAVAQTVSIALGAAVDMVPFAATGPAAPSEGVGVTSTVGVSDTAGFVPGMTVYIDGWSGTVQTVGRDDASVSILWADQHEAGSIAEGDAFARSVYDVASGNAIDVNGNAYACGYEGGGVGDYDSALCADAIAEGNPLPGMTADELFETTFGMTIDAFNAAYPPVTTFDGQADAGRVVNVNGSLNLTGNTEICGGPAILLVQGDLTLNGSCDPSAPDASDGGFHGLIYVTGQFRQQGNSDIFGAVVVDGSYSNVGPDTTTVTGTNNPQADGSKIQYDMAALLQAGSALSPATFEAVAGTWRQR